jgi:hypothetical protein
MLANGICELSVYIGWFQDVHAASLTSLLTTSSDFEQFRVTAFIVLLKLLAVSVSGALFWHFDSINLGNIVIDKVYSFVGENTLISSILPDKCVGLDSFDCLLLF